MKHPIQPIDDVDGVLRFRENPIVRYILDNGGIDLNHLARKCFSNEDSEHFAMLIGYSLSGFGSLSYVSDETYNAARAMADGTENEKDAKIAALEEMLREAREGLRNPIAALFGIHPDDLTR